MESPQIESIKTHILSVLDLVLHKKFLTPYCFILRNASMIRDKATSGFLGNDFELIDFDKYLNCPDCQKVEFYCAEHRIEVEKILQM